MTHCTHCGAEVGETAHFCAQCGSAIAAAEPFSGADLLRQAKTFACEAADDMIDAGEELVSSDLGKKLAAGAAVGALVAAPVPIVGWAAGAAVGAGLVALKQVIKKV